MGSGLFTGAMTPERIANLPQDDWRHRNPDFPAPKLEAEFRIRRALENDRRSARSDAAVVALAWVLHNQAITAAIVGLRRPGQLAGVVGAADFG